MTNERDVHTSMDVTELKTMLPLDILTCVGTPGLNIRVEKSFVQFLENPCIVSSES
jgi:hypothetical protein